MSMDEINEAMMNTMLKGAEGAWAIGSRVEKSFSEPGDRNPVGTKGTVRGSLRDPSPQTINGHRCEYMYLIKFDTEVTCVACADFKLKLIDEKK